MSATPQAISIANDDTITALVRTASRRLVVLAPAVTNVVANAVVETWRRLGAGAVTVILDVDPEVYRLGYGEPEALTLLEKTAKELITVLHRQRGIRIGLVIADDTTMVYSPTPLLIESASRRAECPNAVVLGPPPSEVERELGIGPQGIKDRRVGLEAVDAGAVNTVLEDLRHNPPQRFDVSRIVRVFNARFEFVEFELKNVAIDRKSVSIPTELMGLAADEEIRRLLKTTFKLVDDNHELSARSIEEKKSALVGAFLRPIKGYGNVILRSSREEFEHRVDQLREQLKEFQSGLHDRLQRAIDQSREKLHTMLLPAVKANPPNKWKWPDGTSFDEERLAQCLDEALRKAFGRAESVIGEMEVKLVFKGVTYESLMDKEFQQAAAKALRLDDLFQEYDATKAIDPLEPRAGEEPRNRNE